MKILNLIYLVMLVSFVTQAQITVDPSGNVGIGTTNPDKPLTVKANPGSTELIGLRDASNDPKWHLNLNSGGLNFVESGEADYRFFLKEGGNVGIGVHNPVEKFQIGDRWTFHNGGNKVIGYNFNYAGGDKRILQDESSAIRLQQDGSIRLHTAPSGNAGGSIAWTTGLYIGNDGNVGIGTINPDATLAVRGDIHTQEVRVDLNGAVAPDFVFEPDYALRTLEETEAYIKVNKHLPEIPSAAEMEKNGIKLKEMNLKLLQKVEELTLYTIEQHKKIEEMQEDINQLKNDKK